MNLQNNVVDTLVKDADIEESYSDELVPCCHAKVKEGKAYERYYSEAYSNSDVYCINRLYDKR